VRSPVRQSGCHQTLTAVFSQAKIRQDKKEFTKGVLAQFDHNHSGVTVSLGLYIFDIS
jgi:hypothetical protein